jgi:benzoate-CoA ligase family protein
MARENLSEVVDRVLDDGGSERIAFVADAGETTYGALHGNVARAGHLLRQVGVRREERVLLVLDDSPVFPALFLGAIRIGAVPVPVNAQEAADRLRHFVHDSRPSAVVCEADRGEALLSLVGAQTIVLVNGCASGRAISLGQALASQKDEIDPEATRDDDPAFWLYSSGSTGQPKAAVHLQHDARFVCENFAGRLLGVTAEDRIFSTTKMSHAYGLGNSLLFPLWFGASSVLNRGAPTAASIMPVMQRSRPSIFCSVPAVYSLLARLPRHGGEFDGVRICLSASEPLPASTLHRWRERFGTDIVDGIGSTEMLHIYCCNEPGKVIPGSSGRVVPGYEVRLVDDDGSIVDGCSEGVMHVSGDSCAAYYWHDHERTKASIQGAWFVTGDRYRRNEDGDYTYVGRNDEMMKVGGVWVSPVDLEDALARHPRVSAVGVTGVRVRDAVRIAALVECAEPVGDGFAAELRSWCGDNVSGGLYPHLVHVVRDLPRTTNGKLDRRALAALAESAGGAPKTSIRLTDS